MTIFLLKSLLSLLLLGLAVYGMYAMFAALGGDASAAAAERLKQRHKASGYAYLFLVALISYLCLSFAVASRTEPTPRAALHVLLALSIAGLFFVKVLFIRRFRQFYGQVRNIGIVMGVMSFVMVGISAGYFLAVSRFGLDRTMDRSAHFALRGPFLELVPTGRPVPETIRTDRRSIGRGGTLFAAKCAACHDPLSTKTLIGPGLQGLLKRPTLPLSGHPATAESIRFQLRQPLGRMPSFAGLSDDELSDLIAYLNTL